MQKQFPPELKIKPEKWLYDGLTLLKLGEYNEAIKSFDEAIKLFDEGPDYEKEKEKAKYIRDLACDYLDRYDEAIKLFDEAIMKEPNDAYLWRYKGLFLCYLHRYNEAIKSFDEAIMKEPNDAYIWYDKGIVLHDVGKYKEAVKCFDKATDLDRNNAYLWFRKGLSFDKLGEYSNTIRSFYNSMKLGGIIFNVKIKRLGIDTPMFSKYIKAFGYHDQYLPENVSSDINSKKSSHYPIHILILLIGVLSIVVVTGSFSLLTPSNNFQISGEAISWGIIGALWREIWDLRATMEITNKIEYFITVVFLGGAFGFSVALIIFGILFVFHVSSDQIKILSLIVISSASIMGYNWKLIITNWGTIPNLWSTTNYVKKPLEYNSEKNEKEINHKITSLGITKKNISNYESEKKVLYGAIVFLVIFVIIFSLRNSAELGILYLILVVWLNAVIAKLIQLLDQSRTEHGYHFAKASMEISLEEENEVKKIEYLIIGLNSYNKYLRGRLKLEIKDLKKLYSKISSASIEDKNKFIASMSYAFEKGHELEPAWYLSTKYLKIKDTEQFLTKEPLQEKIKEWASILIPIITVLFTAIQLILVKK